MKETIIVGGGASGVAAAISCGRNNANGNKKNVCSASFDSESKLSNNPKISDQCDVLLIEKNEKLLKKIYATGNGRCNITNVNADSFERVKNFLHSAGIDLIEENFGRIYPMSEKADDVVYALENMLSEIPAEVNLNESVIEIKKEKAHFIVKTDNEIYTCKNLILALGGKAGAVFGSTGDGYNLAKSMGHSINKPIPALTGIECVGDFSELKGTRAKAKVSMYRKGVFVDSQQGEVQFTEYGLSGICIFNLSGNLIIGNGTSMEDYEISIDFSHGRDIQAILRRRNFIDGIKSDNILLTVLPKKIGSDIFRRMNIKTNNRTFSENEIAKLVAICKDYRFRVKGARGWKMAQCTKGGVPLDEINSDSMESKIVKNLYIIGELTDYDGPCGGYNLNYGWLTGIKAGEHVSNK